MSSYAAALGSRRDAGDDLLFGDDDEFGSLAPAHKPRPVKADAVLAGAQVLVAKGVEAHTDGHATTAGASDAHTTGHETPRLPESNALQLDVHANRPAAQEVVPSHAPQAAPHVHLAPADMQLALVPTPGGVDCPSIEPDAKFFIIKSYNHDNIGQSITTGVWSTQAHNEAKLGAAFAACPQVLLIFSVNGSGHFQGYARMETPIGRAKGRWAGDHTRQLGSLFGIQWLCLHDVPFGQTNHLLNPLNEGKPVKISRDGQELPHSLGAAMVQLLERGAAAAGAPRPKPRPEVEWEETAQGEVVPSAVLGQAAAPPHHHGGTQQPRGRSFGGRGDQGGPHGRHWGHGTEQQLDGGTGAPPPGWWGPPPGWVGGYGMPPHGYGAWGPPPAGWGAPPPGWGGGYEDDRGADRRPRSSGRRRSRSRSRSRERGRDRKGR